MIVRELRRCLSNIKAIHSVLEHNVQDNYEFEGLYDTMFISAMNYEH